VLASAKYKRMKLKGFSSTSSTIHIWSGSVFIFGHRSVRSSVPRYPSGPQPHHCHVDPKHFHRPRDPPPARRRALAMSFQIISLAHVSPPPPAPRRAGQASSPPPSPQPAPPHPRNPYSSVPPSISQVHVDCDLYSSTAQALDPIACRLAVGSVIAFDEFIGYVHYFVNMFCTRDRTLYLVKSDVTSGSCR
jgi:hypothetical protein